jgi:SAM-dependent methyltransferase
MPLPLRCPLCSAASAEQCVVTPHVYGSPAGRGNAFFHCLSCDVRYQFPGLSPSEATKFYAAEFEHFMAGRSGDLGGWLKTDDHISANEATRLRRMSYIEPYLDDQADLLEVGCSSGFMLYPLLKKGCNCTGIEPSGVFREFISGRGINVYDSFENMRTQNRTDRFNLIMHFFVLEHIQDPLAFLLDQLSLLKPNGHIVFEVPNAADPLYSLYDIPEFEKFYWSVAHPWYFSEISLQYLLDQTNHPYKIHREQRYDLSNHMIWARDGKPGGSQRFTPDLGKEIEELYKDALKKSGKCDTLIGVISKS